MRRRATSDTVRETERQTGAMWMRTLCVERGALLEGQPIRRLRAMMVALSLTFATAGGLFPAAPSASAATMTFGSPLAVPATKNTANDLNYSGSNIALPESTFHIYHDGADTSLWNVQLSNGSPNAPASGQISSVSLEGCAQSNGPAPLTQIHFQDLLPQSGGGAQVDVTTQAFEIPACGQGGASGSTLTTYQPTNFCVAQGDYVDFADEGGFVPNAEGPPPYPSGVPYQVIGAVSGSTMDSFIRNGGVNNGVTFSPGEMTYHDGFASNQNEELMLQATLATGPDASPLCPGGTKGVVSHKPPPPHHVFPVVTLPQPQLDGVNAHGIVEVAVFCHATSGLCDGALTLRSSPGHGSRSVWLGQSAFSLSPHRTGKVRVHLSSFAQRLVRKTMGRLGVEVTLTSNPAAGTGALKASIALRGGHRP
jgi:hypothetical protein